MKKYVILGVVVITLFSLQIASTYGLFETTTDRSVEVDVAKWDILVNDSIIDTTQKFTITGVTVNSGSKVKEGVWAPGDDAYFDIIINPNNTQVAFTYELTFDFSDITNTEITLSSVQELNGNTLSQTSDNTYSGVVFLDNKTTQHIRITFNWNNNEDNNDVDYATSLKYRLDVPIEISFKQLIM